MATKLLATPTRRGKFKANPQTHIDREALLKQIFEDHKHTFDALAK
jgi:hypothetical protein